MITQDQAKTEATHTDENGNLYRVVGDKPQEFCVDYFDLRFGMWCQDMGKDFSHLIPTKKARAATQCRAVCGKVGTFLYSHKTENGFVPISPVFGSHVELSFWIKENGWYGVGGTNGHYEKN